MKAYKFKVHGRIAFPQMPRVHDRTVTRGTVLCKSNANDNECHDISAIINAN